jgi:threonylcarbamoyladenosine tRNA methylthiotransferase MtaB
MRVFFTNLGCKLNQAENDGLARQLLAAGHELATSLAAADLHVVNSCTVTAEAARSSRKAARAAQRLGAAAARPRTVLTGCFATASPAEAAALPGVDLVVANHDKHRLVELAGGLLRTARAPGGASAVSSIQAAPAPDPRSCGHTRAFLKVEDGCDMRCSFCIIPSTRGRETSRPPQEVLADARRMIEAGYREIVLTGVQISAYRSPAGGSEPDGRGDAALRLGDLVQALLDLLPPSAQGSRAAAPPPVRLRLTSIAPWELDSRLLDLWKDRRLCRHLHLSLQSGAGATLRRMRRPYSPAGFRRVAERARAAIPGLAITTDVIVGFPGETAAEFAESLQTVASLGFAKVHVFPYSARSGTAAELLPEAVSAGEVRRRMDEMLSVAARSEEEFRTAQVGRRATVLWERPSDGRGQGLTDNYIRVWCAAAASLWNQLSDVELTALTGGGMTGRLVEPPPA